jgi:spore germination protein
MVGPFRREVVSVRVRSWSAVLAAATSIALVVTFGPASGATDQSPQIQPRHYVTGWLPYWDANDATDSVVSHSDVFDDASPFVFNVESATDVQLKLSSSAWHDMLRRLRQAGVSIVPTLASDLTADEFAAILKDRSRMHAHVRTLVHLAHRYNVDGLDLDYESINFGSNQARHQVRKLYPRFVKLLEHKLQQQGRLLSVTVAARTSATDPNWRVYDYPRLGSAADRLRIMTYDYHWSGGPAGPMAPMSWIEQVLDYATRVVNPSKISFGLPAYGRDWFKKSVHGTCPSFAHTTLSRTTRGMQVLAANEHVHPKWNARGTSRTFTYVRHYHSGGYHCKAKRVVWYDDAKSVAAKLPLVEQYQIRGVAIWALGYESSGMWKQLTGYGQRVALQKPAVTVTVPQRLAFGNDTTVDVTVSSRMGPAVGEPTTLQRRSIGSSLWRTVRTVNTDADGHASFNVTPQRPLQWRVQTPRGWALLPNTTHPVSTQVAYRVHVHGAHRVVERGDAWTLRGTATKATTGTRALRQVRVDGKWVTKGSTVVAQDGAFRFDLHGHGHGTRTLRVVAVAGQLARGSSRHITVTVN